MTPAIVHYFKKNLGSYQDILEKLLLLQPNSVPFSARKGMKRESGANPEQSRCCKPH